MATAYLIQQPSLNQASQAASAPSGSFSPLTMFECTISSATMLIDSMAVRDLLVAFKIVAQLHGHLLEVLDPTVQRLANVADEHSLCQPATLLAAHRNLTTAASSSSSVALPAGVAANSSAGFSSTPAAAAALRTKRSPPGSEDEDDCVLIEADVQQLLDSQQHQLHHHQQQHHHHQAKISRPSLVADSGGGGGGAPGELTNEWKATLRKAYRVMKDETGTNVFDFSLPYSAGTNTQAAQRVIDRALALSRQKPQQMAAWQIAANKYFHSWYNQFLKRNFKERCQQGRVSAMIRFQCKLNRRQRAFDAIKLELDLETRAKAEAALSRDYTSSDEEFGGTADASGDLAAASAEPSQLRVRILPWESEELRQLKRLLDDAFLERLASSDPAQVAEVSRVRREPGLYSSRQPPSDTLDWAKTEPVGVVEYQQHDGYE